MQRHPKGWELRDITKDYKGLLSIIGPIWRSSDVHAKGLGVKASGFLV